MQEGLMNWQLLLRFYLRRDAWKIGIWIVSLAGFAGGILPAFEEIAKDGGASGIYETLKNPAMIAMLGPTSAESAMDYTIGAMYAHQMLLFSALIAMLLAALHMIRHTRRAEEEGLLEMVRALPVGRQANAFALLVEMLIVHLLLALFIMGLMVSFSIPTVSLEGACLFALSVSLAGFFGAALGLFFAQIMPQSGGAIGGSLAAIGLLYVLRGMTDISYLSLSYFNPLGLTYLTYPFTEDRWGLSLVLFIVILILAGFSLVIEGRRDLGASLFLPRGGRHKASRSLTSLPGLLLRLNRGQILAWLTGLLVIGSAYGSVYGEMQSFISSNELMQQMFTVAGFSLEKSFTAMIMMVMASLAAILPISVVYKLFREEEAGRLNQVLASPVSRGQLYWSTMTLAVLLGLVGILLSAASLGLTAGLVMAGEGGIQLSDFFAAGLNLLPALFFYTGGAALCLGFKPALRQIVYVYLGYAFFISYFSDMFNFPDLVEKTAIHRCLPELPVEPFAWTPFLTLSCISLLMIWLGYQGYKKRDLLE